MRMRKYILFAVFTVSILLGVVVASDKSISGFSPEAYLQREGVSLDDESLIVVARKNERPVLRRKAIQVLAKSGDHLELFKEIATEDDYYMVRVEAARLVGTNNSEFAVAALKNELTGRISTLTSVRISEYLADLQDASGFSVICSALKGQNTLCRIKAARSIVKFAKFENLDAEVNRELLDALESSKMNIESDDLRKARNAQKEINAILEGLSLVGDAKIMPRLVEIEKQFKDQTARESIRAVIHEIGLNKNSE